MHPPFSLFSSWRKEKTGRARSKREKTRCAGGAMQTLYVFCPQRGFSGGWAFGEWPLLLPPLGRLPWYSGKAFYGDPHCGSCPYPMPAGMGATAIPHRGIAMERSFPVPRLLPDSDAHMAIARGGHQSSGIIIIPLCMPASPVPSWDLPPKRLASSLWGLHTCAGHPLINHRTPGFYPHEPPVET